MSWDDEPPRAYPEPQPTRSFPAVPSTAPSSGTPVYPAGHAQVPTAPAYPPSAWARPTAEPAYPQGTPPRYAAPAGYPPEPPGHPHIEYGAPYPPPAATGYPVSGQSQN